MLGIAALASLLLVTTSQPSTCPVTRPNHSRVPAIGGAGSPDSALP